MAFGSDRDGSNSSIKDTIIAYLGAVVVVSMLAFYSDDLSLKPAEAYSFFCKIEFEKNENNKKRLGWPTFF